MQGRRGGEPHALAVELVARAEADEHPALAAGVADGEVAVLGLRLARRDEPVEHAVDVVVDLLAVEHADHDGVGIGVLRQRGGGFDDHPRQAIQALARAGAAAACNPRHEPASRLRALLNAAD